METGWLLIRADVHLPLDQDQELSAIHSACWAQSAGSVHEVLHAKVASSFQNALLDVGWAEPVAEVWRIPV